MDVILYGRLIDLEKYLQDKKVFKRCSMNGAEGATILEEQGIVPDTQAGTCECRALIEIDEYEQLMNETPSKYKGEDRPVEQLSWHDAELSVENSHC